MSAAPATVTVSASPVTVPVSATCCRYRATVTMVTASVPPTVTAPVPTSSLGIVPTSHVTPSTASSDHDFPTFSGDLPLTASLGLISGNV